jgi:hypothetical protein
MISIKKKRENLISGMHRAKIEKAEIQSRQYRISFLGDEGTSVVSPVGDYSQKQPFQEPGSV